MKSTSRGAGYRAGAVLIIMVLLCWAMPKVYSAGSESTAAKEGGTDVGRTTRTTRSFVANPFAPALPGAHKVAFASDRTDENFEIYTMNDDGTGITRLTTDSGDDHSPAINTIGSRIAFVSNRDGNTDIYVMDANGSNQTQLTTDGASDLSPAFSPDGTKIAFVSSRTGNDEIFVMNANGSSQTQLTNNPASDFGPTWSPDGTKIAFTTDRDANSEIYAMLANGTSPTNLTFSSGDDLSPAWSSGRITFQSDRTGNFDIFSMNDLNGSGVVQLTNDPADDTDPARSLNNSQLLFMSTRDGNYELYTALADGSTQTKVTTEDASDLEPSVITINNAPTLDPISNLTILANSGNQVVNLTGISAGADESQTLTVTAVSSNTGIIPHPTVTYTSPNSTGSINFAPVANTVGSVDITVTVTDDGGTANGGINSVSRTFTVNVVAPDLTVSKTHAGNFDPGTSETYTITVTNSGGAPTSASVNMTDTLPVGLTPTGPVGAHNGWFCTIVAKTVSCARGDVAAANTSYPPITLTVNVANPAPLTVTNTATVSGGGEFNTSNNSSSDVTAINCAQDASLNNTSPLVISRFRENGPGGVTDEFVEIFNSANTPHTVASGTCTGGYGVFASAGNGTTSNTVSMVCQIPNATVIPARGYYLCTGAGYTLGNLGRNGGIDGATSTSDAPIGCAGNCVGDIPNDAGLALANVGSNIIVNTLGGFVAAGIESTALIVYDKVGFSAYGAGAPASSRPSLADNFCEGACLQPVGDASTLPTCTNPTGSFPVTPVPPACYGQSGQYELLRRQTTFNANLGTLHQDTNNNTNDLLMVSPNPGLNVGLNVSGLAGVKTVLGAATPQNSTAPVDMPSVSFTQAPFEGASYTGPRNAERIYSQDPTIANPLNDPLGTYSLRFRFTNNTGLPLFPIRFRVDDLSTLCGPQNGAPTVGTGNAKNLSSTPDCGTAGFSAILKLVNSVQQIVVDSGGTAQYVYGSVLDDLSVGAPPAPGPLSPLGGGIDNTVTPNPSNNPASLGDGVNGGTGQFNSISFSSPPVNVFRIRFKFGVVQTGRFAVLVTPQAKLGPPPFPD